MRTIKKKKLKKKKKTQQSFIQENALLPISAQSGPDQAVTKQVSQITKSRSGRARSRLSKLESLPDWISNEHIYF